MAHLRLADEQERAPIGDDETAKAEIGDHWRAARDEYAELLGAIAPVGLRWLAANHSPRGGLRHGHFYAMAKDARDIAARATALADHLQRASDVFDRRAAK